LIVCFATIFFLQNRQPVYIQFPFTRECRFGLIYLLLTAYLVGSLTTFFSVILIGRKIKKRRKIKESQELIEEG
jgi:uncharacterized integral membrane protein